MEINQEVIKKIKVFVIKKNLKDLSSPMSNQGKHVYESEYDLAVNERVNDLVFVVSVRVFYVSSRIEDKRYGIYAFDKNTGEEVKNFEDTDKCYFNFFNDLTVIENIL